jgi:hypothetical protein
MTDLSETIARAERAAEVGKSLRVPPSILPEDLALLLATARRVQAMDALDVDQLRSIEWAGAITKERFRALVDLASDQSAARARVATLETNNARLTETSMARLRTIERITAATRADVSNDARLDLVRDALTAAKVTP